MSGTEPLHGAIEAARQLRLNIAVLLRLEEGEISANDLHALQDSFDGETTLDVELAKAIEAEDDDKILVDGITARLAELADRRDRLRKRIESRRGLIEQAMVIAGWKNHETPLGTISLGKASAKVEIEDESVIPSQYWRRADPTVDKAAIGKLLKDFQKRVDAALKIGNTIERGDALRAILVDPALPYHTERNACVSSALFINDSGVLAAEFERILKQYPLVPGARLEASGQTLTIRRK